MFIGLILFLQLAWADELHNAVKLANNVLEAPEPTQSQFVCEDPPADNSIRTVNAHATTNQRGCEPLAEGKHRLMERNRYQSGDYLMRNLGSGRFAAVLNLDFKAGRGATPQMVEMIKQRTMNCLRELAPLMRNGNEKLEIQVIEPRDRLASGIPRPEANVINVTPQPADYRGDAGNYGTNFTCMTIGHEVLHLLGLCDEYHEGIKEIPKTNGRTGYADWSCRPVTTSLSYMRNLRAYNFIVPQSQRCKCNAECQRLMRAPAEIRNMFLTMGGEDYLTSEMSLLGNHIDSINSAGQPVMGRRYCTQLTESLGPNEKPPVMKSFVYEGETNNVFKFTTYRPRHTQGPTENDSFYWFGFERLTCDCRNDQRGYCRRLVQAIAERARQSHQRVTCPMDVSSPDQFEPTVGRQTQGSGLDPNDPSILVLRSPGIGQSLLLPQHFERIKAGNCRGGAARNYETCEEYSYTGKNRANGYEMSLPQNPNVNLCTNVPAQCRDDRFYLEGRSSVSGQ